MLRHPLSAIFAHYDLQGSELQELADDIKAHGLRSPITTYDGMILDGWNRFQACSMGKVKPVFQSLADHIDPKAFVISCNMMRRQILPRERSEIMLAMMRGLPNFTNDPDEANKTVYAALSADLLTRLDSLARQRKCTRNALIREAVEELLDYGDFLATSRELVNQ